MPDATPLRINPSSMLRSAAYDAERGELHIVFANGQRWIYRGVPQDEADGLEGATSAGKHFLEAIRDRYEGRRA